MQMYNKNRKKAMGWHKSTRDPHADKALHEVTKRAFLKRLEEQQDTIPHPNALKSLRGGTWPWRMDAFRACIRDNFGVEPEALKLKHYNEARMLIDNNAVYRQYHYVA